MPRFPRLESKIKSRDLETKNKRTFENPKNTGIKNQTMYNMVIKTILVGDNPTDLVMDANGDTPEEVGGIIAQEAEKLGVKIDMSQLPASALSLLQPNP